MVFVDLVKWTARNKLDRGQLVIAMVTLMVSLMTSCLSAVNPVSTYTTVNVKLITAAQFLFPHCNGGY